MRPALQTSPFANRLALATIGIALSILPVHAVTLFVTYELDEGSASFDSFDIPNPDGGADLTITPSLTIDSGSFEAFFETGTGVVGLGAGSAGIRGLNFSGTISMTVATVIDTGIFPIPVEATLSGPINGIQNSDSNGTYAILGGSAVYTDTSPGNYDVSAGPIGCTSPLFNAVCLLLEAGLEIDFPIEIPAVENAPLPFVGLFDDLDSPGASTSGSAFDFSIPLGDTVNFGADLNFTWQETSRLVVPEPSLAILGPLALAFLARRRREI